MCPTQPYRFSVANLAYRGKKVRLVSGVLGLVATIIVATVMISNGVHPLWRWSLFLPAFLSILNLLQAFTSTCVVLAALGAWDLGCGAERVPDPRIDAALRSRAWKLVASSAAVAILFTLAAAYCGR